MAENSYTMTGILHIKGQTNKVSEKFTKREVVLSFEEGDKGQYVQYIPMQLTQDRCSLLDTHAVGDEVKVHFNIKGRKWTSPQGEDKYFSQMEIWKIEGMKYDRIVEDASRITKNAPAIGGKQELTQEIRNKAQLDDDQLPF